MTASVSKLASYCSGMGPAVHFFHALSWVLFVATTICLFRVSTLTALNADAGWSISTVILFAFPVCTIAIVAIFVVAERAARARIRFPTFSKSTWAVFFQGTPPYLALAGLIYLNIVGVTIQTSAVLAGNVAVLSFYVLSVFGLISALILLGHSRTTHGAKSGDFGQH